MTFFQPLQASSYSLAVGAASTNVQIVPFMQGVYGGLLLQAYNTGAGAPEAIRFEIGHDNTVVASAAFGTVLIPNQMLIVPIELKDDPNIGVNYNQCWVAAVGAAGGLTTLYITPGVYRFN